MYHLPEVRQDFVFSLGPFLVVEHGQCSPVGKQQEQRDTNLIFSRTSFDMTLTTNGWCEVLQFTLVT